MPSISARRRTVFQNRLRHRRLNTDLPPVASAALANPRAPTEGELCLDLLHHEPAVRVDGEAYRRGLRFAFESGDAGGLLSETVQDAPVVASNWNPDHFASSLFVSELVERILHFRVGKTAFEPAGRHLTRLLSQPPNARSDVDLRQTALVELLAKRELRSSVEELWVRTRRLRQLLDERPIGPGETVRRKMEVLSAIKELFERASDDFADATSALGRIGDYASTVCESEEFDSLRALVQFDREMAQVDVRIVVGSDGRIRSFTLERMQEDLTNPLVAPWWKRLLARVWRFVRGYRFTESQVLLKVVDEVFLGLEDALVGMALLAGDLEFYLSALALKDAAERVGLRVCLPELTEAPRPEEPSGPRDLRGLFNPLLLLADTKPVPCDVELDGHDALAVVTGPNSGGKTRLLQAVSVSQMLAQAGMLVPAASARLTRAPNLFVSLIERASADEREGRLGTELMRVRRLFEQLESGSFVVLDELCSGTNPSEGVAIFEMVISLLPRLRPQVLVTTHFLDAARRLQQERTIERLSFLQVELSEEEEPTYQFVPGVAPTSLAGKVAARLGVTREELEALVDARRGPTEPAQQTAVAKPDPIGERDERSVRV